MSHISEKFAHEWTNLITKEFESDIEQLIAISEKQGSASGSFDEKSMDHLIQTFRLGLNTYSSQEQAAFLSSIHQQKQGLNKSTQTKEPMHWAIFRIV